MEAGDRFVHSWDSEEALLRILSLNARTLARVGQIEAHSRRQWVNFLAWRRGRAKFAPRTCEFDNLLCVILPGEKALCGHMRACCPGRARRERAFDFRITACGSSCSQCPRNLSWNSGEVSAVSGGTRSRLWPQLQSWLTAARQGQTPITKKGGTLIYLRAADPHQSLSAGRRLLSQRRRAQPDHRQAHLRIPKTLEIEPWIAESWTVNADATEYVFKIRPGVTFSDGTPLDAAAVAKNFDDLRAGQQGAEASGLRGDHQLQVERGDRSADGEVHLHQAVGRLPAEAPR